MAINNAAVVVNESFYSTHSPKQVLTSYFFGTLSL